MLIENVVHPRETSSEQERKKQMKRSERKKCRIWLRLKKNGLVLMFGKERESYLREKRKKSVVSIREEMRFLANQKVKKPKQNKKIASCKNHFSN